MSDGRKKPRSPFWGFLSIVVGVALLSTAVLYAVVSSNVPIPEPCVEPPFFSTPVWVTEVSSSYSNVFVQSEERLVRVDPYSDFVRFEVTVENDGQCPHSLTNFYLKGFDAQGWYLGWSVVGELWSPLSSGEVRTLTLTIQQMYTYPCPLDLWHTTRTIAVFGFAYDEWTVVGSSPCGGPGPVA